MKPMLLILVLFLLSLLGCPVAVSFLVTGTPAVTPNPTPTPNPAVLSPDACSENPYYAAALIAMNWIPSYPSGQIASGDAYGHAQLDALYAQLYADGKVGPLPPPCMVTVRDDLAIWNRPGVDYLGIMRAGETAAVYGRDAEGHWWYVNYGTGWGWISSEYAQIQPEAEISAIPMIEG